MATSRNTLRIVAECLFEVDVQIEYSPMQEAAPTPRVVADRGIEILKGTALSAFCPVGRGNNVLLLSVRRIERVDN